MREWIDEISDYIQEKEKVASPLDELSEQIYQAALEADLLLEASYAFAKMDLKAASEYTLLANAAPRRNPNED